MSGTFKKAGTYFQRGQYGEVIRLLEPQVFRFRDSYDFYFLLGMSCLYTNDIGSSFTYLQRAYDLSTRNKEVLQALAVVHLHRKENNEALRCWLHVLEIDPRDKRASKGLNILRSSIKKEELMDNLEEGKFDKLLPIQKKNGKRWFPLIIIIAIAAIAGLSIPIIIRNLDINSLKRTDFHALDIRDYENILETTGDYYFLMTEDEVSRTVTNINDFLLDYRDNLAMREINRLLLSNVDSELKNKVSMFEDNITTPGFTDFQDNFSYDDVKSEPFLYRKCFVIWRGRATNVNISDDNIRFDFLIGYEDEKVLEGIVTVFLDFSADITPDFPLEVLAEVVPSSGGDFYLSALAIHRIWE